MKIYFTASARGIKQFGKNFQKIHTKIQDLGHNSLDTSIIESDGTQFYSVDHKQQVKLFERAIQYIKNSDIVVLEVSIHSLSMGYVMDRALDMGKPVIALFMHGYEPYFALGIKNERLQVVEYKEDNLAEILTDAIEYARENTDTRFNFFLPPSLMYYLDWVAEKKKIPRSVYLRELIEKDRDKNKEYVSSM